MERQEVLFSKKASSWFRGLAIFMVILSHLAEWFSWFFQAEGTGELLRQGLSKLGPYGVAVFFLFSGYGLTKSAGEGRIGFSFLIKRLLAVYVPYLTAVLLIDVLSGSIHGIRDLIPVLYGQEFWYMTVLFLFYGAFLIIWAVIANPHGRAVLMALFTLLLCHVLYRREMQDFWYLSNPAFLVGVLLALYEPFFVKLPKRWRAVLMALFFAGSAGAVYSGLFAENVFASPEAQLGAEMLAVFVFTAFVSCFASLWQLYDPVLPVFGKYSLYLYLFHTFLFMWVINHTQLEMKLRFLLAVLTAFVLSLALGMGISYGIRQLQRIGKGKKATSGNGRG